jgi:hypothetical protein
MRLRPLITFAACAGLLVSPLAATAFSMREIRLPADAIAPGAKVHPVDVIGDARKEFVVVQRGDAYIYALGEKGFERRQQFPIPTSKVQAGKTYYNFVRMGEGERRNLMLLAPEGVYYFPTDGNTIAAAPQQLFRKNLIQGQEGGQSIQHLEFALDLNNDGLDDLLIPEQNGFSIYRQDPGQKFTPVELPRNPYKVTKDFSFVQALPEDAVRIPSISGAISQRRGVSDLLLFDANGDKLVDLIYTSVQAGANSKQIERYEVFLQHKSMTFGSAPAQIMDIPYEGNADMTFRDLNRDARLDAISIRSNYDLVNPKTLVKIYMSTGRTQQLFTRETDRFVTKDPIGLVRIADFNNDSMIDFAMTFFSYQFGSAEDIVDLALANKVKFKLQFFLGQGPRGFDRQPSFEKELVLNMKTETYRGYPPVLIVDDMNGDGIMDLIARSDENKVAVFPSEGKLAYARSPAATYEIPADSHIEVEDVNADGLADMLVSSLMKQSVVIYISEK